MSRKPSLSGKSTPKAPTSSHPATPIRASLVLTPPPEVSPTTAGSGEPEIQAADTEGPALVPLTPLKTPFEEVPFRNVDYKSLTLEDLIQRSARRVKIGPNGEEIQETWIEVKMKLNSRANSELRPARREDEGLLGEKQEEVVVSWKEQFAGEEAGAGGIPESPPPPPSPIPESPRGSKSVQTDESPTPTPVLASAKPPRRSARLAQKRAQRTQATPSASPSPIVKRKRAQSKPSSTKRPKRGGN